MEASVRVHIGKYKRHILINNQSICNLRQFQVDANTSSVLTTLWEYIGNGPHYITAPNDLFSNEIYPLRFDIGSGTPQTKVILLSKPLGKLKSLYLKFFAGQKDLMRIESFVSMKKDVVDTLVDLGVEVDMPGNFE